MKNKLKELLCEVKKGILEYPVTFFSSIVLWLSLTIDLFVKKDSFFAQFWPALSFASMFLLIASAALVVWRQKKNKARQLFKDPLFYLSLAISLAQFLIAYFYPDNNYVNTGLLTVNLVMLAFFLINILTKKNIMHLICTAFFAAVVGLALGLGLNLCLLAIDKLLYAVNDKLYAAVFFFSFIVIAANFFLAILQIDNEENPKFLKGLFNYVLFPSYLILMTVLYLYFIKILFQWQLPKGQLNHFVLAAEVCYIAFRWLMRFNQSRPVKLFYKYGHFFLLPCLALQISAIAVRVSAYGLTPARWLGILFVAIFTIYLVLIIFKGSKYEKSIFYLAMIMALISTLTPLHYKDIPAYQQLKQLNSCLTKYGYLKDGQLQKIETKTSEKISFADKKTISSCYKALRHHRLSPQYFYEDKIDKQGKPYQELVNFEQLYGFRLFSSNIKTEKDLTENYYYSTPKRIKSLNVQGYSKVLIIDEHYQGKEYSQSKHKMVWKEKSQNRIIIKVDKKTYDLSQIIKNKSAENKFYQIDKQTKIILEYVNFQYSSDQQAYEGYGLGGYLLKK